MRRHTITKLACPSVDRGDETVTSALERSRTGLATVRSPLPLLPRAEGRASLIDRARKWAQTVDTAIMDAVSAIAWLQTVDDIKRFFRRQVSYPAKQVADVLKQRAVSAGCRERDIWQQVGRLVPPGFSVPLGREHPGLLLNCPQLYRLYRWSKERTKQRKLLKSF